MAAPHISYEHQIVQLITDPSPDASEALLRAGDRGTVVHAWNDDYLLVVEFVRRDGKIETATVTADDVRLIH